MDSGGQRLAALAQRLARAALWPLSSLPPPPAAPQAQTADSWSRAKNRRPRLRIERRARTRAVGSYSYVGRSASASRFVSATFAGTVKKTVPCQSSVMHVGAQLP